MYIRSYTSKRASGMWIISNLTTPILKSMTNMTLPKAPALIFWYMICPIPSKYYLGTAGKVTFADLFGLIFKYYFVNFFSNIYNYLTQKLTGTLKNHAIQILALALMKAVPNKIHKIFGNFAIFSAGLSAHHHCLQPR